MSNLGLIYKITNLNNKKEYIGCTIYSLKKRLNEHFFRCKNIELNTKFCNSVRKHGVENFNIELIEECDISIIYEREKYYIDKLNTFNNGLNSTCGGEGCLGYKHNSEIRKKISDILKNGKSNKGKSYEIIYGEKSLEQKQKRRESVKKNWKTLTEKERKSRIDKINQGVKKNVKFSERIIKEIKDKFNKGLKVKDILKEYPDFSSSYLYSIKNNKRRKNN